MAVEFPFGIIIPPGKLIYETPLGINGGEGDVRRASSHHCEVPATVIGRNGTYAYNRHTFNVYLLEISPGFLPDLPSQDLDGRRGVYYYYTREELKPVELPDSS